MLRIHAAGQPVNGDHTAFGVLPPRRVEGGQQPVTIIQIDEDRLAILGCWRVAAQEVPHGLQVGPDPGKAFTAIGRDHITGVIAKKPHGAR